MMRQSIRIAGFFSVSVLAACSGGFERGSSERTGVFVDSPVSGLDYRTATRSAKTTTAGVFTYSDGELVSFSIGGLQLGSANGASALTPMNLVPGATSVSNNRVSNIAVLLQSLDRNLDVRDGLEIPAAAAEKISGFTIDLDKTPSAFSSDGQALAFVRAANNDNRNLVTPAQAQANLQRAQDEMSGNGQANRLPVANAGDDRSVDEGAAVSIAGQGSDADGRIVSYQWSRVSGPAVTLTDANTVTVRFTAPQVSQQTLLTLRLTVTDDRQASASDDVVITIRDTSGNSNTPPVANAGADQTVTEGASVTLDGRASTDAQDGNNLGYAWTQTAGPNVTLNAANSSQPNFTAPSAQTTLGFRLTVSDTQQAQSTDEVQVIVNDSAAPPPPRAFDLCDPVMHTYCLSQVPVIGPALLSALGGSAGSNPVPDRLPVLSEPTPRGNLTVTPVADKTPTPKIIDGDITDWVGVASRIGGTARYDAGEYIYSDYLFDAYGADDGTDQQRLNLLDPLAAQASRTFRLDQLFQAAGDQFGAPSPAGALDHYGDTTSLNDQADLSEVRWAASGNQTYFLARTTTLTDPSKLAILILIDAVPGPASSKPVGFGTTLQTGLFDTAVLLTSAGVQAKDLATGAVLNLNDAQVKINAAGWTNAVEAALPASLFGNGQARVAVIAGPRKADGLTPANVAYRFHEPVAGVYNDKQQALALLAGNIDQFRAEISLDALRRGVSETAKPAPGYHERQFISGENISREEGEDGLLQRYGLYIPKSPALNLQGQTPLTLWMHYRGGKAHSGAAWTPRLITQLGEEQGNIVATPHGRGTSTWYTTQSHQDFFEVFADLAGTAIAGQENLEKPKEIAPLLNVDPDRVYLSGYSMGGYATYLFGLLYPDKFAAGFAQSGAVTQGAWTGVGPDDANCTTAPQNIPGLGENGNACFLEANGGMANAQLKYRILENARHLPIEINHGTNDELALTPGAERMGLRLAELNYRYDMMTFIGYEHYTQAIMDEWADGAAYINRFRRNANPRQVTYKIVPAMVRAVNTAQERGKGPFHFNPNSAYWVSGLVVRTPDLNDPTKFGMIDAVSDAIAAPVIVPVPRTGDVNPTAKSGPQASTPVYSPGYHSTPYVRHGLDWQETPLSTSVLNRFSATLTGLSAATLDLSRMKLDVTRRLDGVLKSDGAATLTLLNVSQPVRVFVNQIERADAYRDGKIMLPLTASDFSTGQALIQIQPPTATLVIDAAATTGIVPLCRSLGPQVQPLCDGIESGTNQLIGGCVSQFGQAPAFCATLGGHLQGIVAACRANNGSVLCKAADTFLEGIASGCRQIPQAPRDFCALLSSQRIAADEITQFEKTWTYRALQLQYELGSSLRFVDSLFPATHNSFNAADANTPPTLSGLDSNQRYTTVDQLRMGIRAIEIDVHWMPRADKMGFAPTVCHGNQEHVGCTLERSLEAELTDVRKWMDANPTQVILIYLENNLNQPTDAPTAMLTGTEPYAAAATVIRNTLGSLLYTPADHGAVCGGGHPLKASINSLRALNKRVYIQTEGCDAGWASLVFNKEAANSHTQSPDTSQLQTFSVDGVCGGFSRADHQRKLTRYFEDGTLVGAVTSQSDTHLGSPEDFRGMVRCGVNMPSMDHVTPSDPRLAAFVWSWEPGQPAVSTTQNCALHTQGARFRAADCAALKPYACVRYSDIVGAPAQKSEWMIGLPAGVGSAGVCPTGYQFATPRNGYENELLRIAKLAANVNEVWLNYSAAATEGAWRIGSAPAP